MMKEWSAMEKVARVWGVNLGRADADVVEHRARPFRVDRPRRVNQRRAVEAVEPAGVPVCARCRHTPEKKLSRGVEGRQTPGEE